ncbi:MAG: hypothetical protein ACREJD_04120 [Phycisphaerales bacterium]
MSTGEIKSSVTALGDGRSFAPKDAAGSYLALQFLPAAAGQGVEHGTVLQDIAKNSNRLAGLKEVFIISEPAAWTASVGDAGSLIFVDSGGALAGELKLSPVSAPATICRSGLSNSNS